MALVVFRQLVGVKGALGKYKLLEQLQVFIVNPLVLYFPRSEI